MATFPDFPETRQARILAYLTRAVVAGLEGADPANLTVEIGPYGSAATPMGDNDQIGLIVRHARGGVARPMLVAYSGYILATRWCKLPPALADVAATAAAAAAGDLGLIAHDGGVWRDTGRLDTIPDFLAAA